jgi:hypothetical protein
VIRQTDADPGNSIPVRLICHDLRLIKATARIAGVVQVGLLGGQGGQRDAHNLYVLDPIATLMVLGVIGCRPYARGRFAIGPLRPRPVS